MASGPAAGLARRRVGSRARRWPSPRRPGSRSRWSSCGATLAAGARSGSYRAAFFAAAALSLLISLAIVLALSGEAIRWLTSIDLGWLWAEGWFPRANQFDIKTIVAGTLIVAAIAMFVAAPLGLGAALYLSEYATPRARRFLKPILEMLASIPSVVLGFFALQVISPDLVQHSSASAGTFNMLAAGHRASGSSSTPLVASVAEDAMHAVPGALREASFGLGARRGPTTHAGRVPGRRLGHRRGADPGHLARDRRDDGRRDRRRRDRRRRCAP